METGEGRCRGPDEPIDVWWIKGEVCWTDGAEWGEKLKGSCN